MSKKAAFTMVELIFVIVILGILAAVAVPRLNASRDDAEITKFIANIAAIKKDAQSYYLAHGTAFTDEAKIDAIYADIAKITSVPLAAGVRYKTYHHNLQIGGENCLDVYVYNSNSIESLKFGRIDKFGVGALCEKALRRDDVAQLLTGATSTDVNSLTIETIVGKNYDDKKDWWVAFLLNASAVNFD